MLVLDRILKFVNIFVQKGGPQVLLMNSSDQSLKKSMTKAEKWDARPKVLNSSSRDGVKTHFSIVCHIVGLGLVKADLLEEESRLPLATSA